MSIVRFTTPPAMAELIQPVGSPPPTEYLRWIMASRGNVVDLIRVAQVCYFQAEAKYTTVVTERGEAVIRRSIKQLAGELDPDCFWRIHRSTIVNVEAIESVTRCPSEFSLKLRSRPTRLAVSEAYRHLFKPM